MCFSGEAFAALGDMEKKNLISYNLIFILN